MTHEEFIEFVKTLHDYGDKKYAYECWDSLTDNEKEKCTTEDVLRDIQGTYEAMAEMIAELEEYL